MVEYEVEGLYPTGIYEGVSASERDGSVCSFCAPRGASRERHIDSEGNSCFPVTTILVNVRFLGLMT